MAQPILKHIPLSDLKVSALNMRHARAKPDISDILPSIRESGVRQTLLVRKEGDRYGVVAGRRRYFALKEIEKETGKTPLVPCAIMPEDDAASAIAASVIENVGRLPPGEMEQYTAFRSLHEAGRSVGEIAVFFGVTELMVKRVLALAGLAAPIRKLYAQEEITPETARALTLASPAQQAEWLNLWANGPARAPQGRVCRAWVAGGQAITADKALFDLAAYEGAVTADLFGDHAVFADAAAFWQAQEAAIAARCEAYRAAGWTEVVRLERGTVFHRWDHTPVRRKAGGKVFVEARHDGTITFHEGFLTQKDAQRLQAAADGATESERRAPRPEMSGPLAEYILLHRHAVAQAALAGAPEIALRLMVAHALVGSALWQVRAHETRCRRAETVSSIERSKAAAEFSARRGHVEELLKGAGLAQDIRRGGDARHLCEVFAALGRMNEADVLTILACVMAETLEAGGETTEAALHVCAPDLKSYWHPDQAFFDLCRDKRALNAMAADIGGQELARSGAGETTAAQRQTLINRIAGNGYDPRPDWRPGWMQIPPLRLVEGAASPPADAWSRISGLFEPRKDRSETEAEAFDQAYVA